MSALAYGLRTLLIAASIAFTLACRAASNQNPSQAATAVAEATATQRVAQATVQRIIAGAPTATAAPQPAATPLPNCAGAIWWHQARAHIGESRVVQGPVVAVRAAAGTTAMLEIGQPYPDPTGVAVMVSGTAGANWQRKMVCISGAIDNREGTPTIQVTDPARIVVVS